MSITRKRTRYQSGFAAGPARPRKYYRPFVPPRVVGIPRAIAQVDTERKYFDEERAITAVTIIGTSWAGCEADPGTVNTLFAPTQGDDISNRTGRRADVMGIRIKGLLTGLKQTAQTTADEATLVRVVLVQDKQTNSAQLNAEDVISSGDATQAFNMFQSTAFFGRFKVLKDKRYITPATPVSIRTADQVTTTAQNMEVTGFEKDFKMNVKFRKPVRVNFNATNGGTVADIIDNSWHILAIANSADQGVRLSYKCRVVFVDP